MFRRFKNIKEDIRSDFKVTKREEKDGRTETDTAVSRALMKYYKENNLPYPSWMGIQGEPTHSHHSSSSSNQNSTSSRSHINNQNQSQPEFTDSYLRPNQAKPQVRQQQNHEQTYPPQQQQHYSNKSLLQSNHTNSRPRMQSRFGSGSGSGSVSGGGNGNISSHNQQTPTMSNNGGTYENLLSDKRNSGDSESGGIPSRFGRTNSSISSGRSRFTVKK